MTESSLQSDPVFIDMATGTDQYPICVVVSHTTKNQSEVAIEKNLDVKLEPSCKTERVPSPTLQTQFTDIQTRRIRCTECVKYTAETEEKMLRHVRKVHRGENPFQCYMCDYSTYNKSLFEEHVRIHQGIKPFKCSHCPYASASKKNTKKHELIHRPDNPHKCKHCDFIARHLRSLQCHINTKHSTKGVHEVKAEKLTLCPLCNKKIENYQLHEKNRKKCKDCNLSFCNNNLVRKHMLTEHSDKNKFAKVDFTCAICKWTSNIKPKILLHLIHHPNQPVDENEIDVHILKECGIQGQGW